MGYAAVWAEVGERRAATVPESTPVAVPGPGATSAPVATKAAPYHDLGRATVRCECGGFMRSDGTPAGETCDGCGGTDGTEADDPEAFAAFDWECVKCEGPVIGIEHPDRCPSCKDSSSGGWRRTYAGARRHLDRCIAVVRQDDEAPAVTVRRMGWDNREDADTEMVDAVRELCETHDFYHEIETRPKGEHAKGYDPAGRFKCDGCGAAFKRWTGPCGECGGWNVLVDTRPKG